MMTLAEFLLNTKHEYNGHKQTEIAGMSLEDGLQLCKELEELCEDEHSFVLEVWTTSDFTLYQKDYFPVGHTGGVDRMILSVSKA